jgi:hypothetical protein
MLHDYCVTSNADKPAICGPFNDFKGESPIKLIDFLQNLGPKSELITNQMLFEELVKDDEFLLKKKDI